MCALYQLEVGIRKLFVHYVYFGCMLVELRMRLLDVGVCRALLPV